MKAGRAAVLSALAAVSLLSACAVGPNYTRPAAPVPPAFKESPPPGQRPEDWKSAEPRDAVSRGKWWEIFGDPELNVNSEVFGQAHYQGAPAGQFGGQTATYGNQAGRQIELGFRLIF